MADTTDRLRASAPDAALVPAASLADGEFTLAMPARRPRWERVQLNARVRVEIEHVLQQFVRDHDTTVQSCVDLALEEFLTARGYPPSDTRGHDGARSYAHHESHEPRAIDARHVVVGTP
jgi:hypothetical protein